MSTKGNVAGTGASGGTSRRSNRARLWPASDSSGSKTGAEAVYGVGDRALGQGAAIKILDGSNRAVAPALIETLVQAGFLSASEAERLAAWRHQVQHNFAGREVGEVRTHFELHRA